MSTPTTLPESPKPSPDSFPDRNRPRDWLFLACQAGHDWQSTGGANCGCEGGACSVPVNVCTRCGDCDYGDNGDAREIRHRCRQRFVAYGPNDDTA